MHYTTRGVHIKHSAGERGEDINYTARGVHIKHSAGPGACTLNAVLGRGARANVHKTWQRHTKHSVVGEIKTNVHCAVAIIITHWFYIRVSSVYSFQVG